VEHFRGAGLAAVALCLTAVCAPSGAAERQRFELPADQRTGSIRRVLVLPHSHLDIGFTRPPDQVARDYKDNIDAAIRLARENADFRWTIESAWMLGEWLRRTSDQSRISELGRLLGQGRIALGAAFANMHSGLMDTEEMNRLVYLAESFRRRFNVAAEVAFQNDVPGFSWAYPRVFAGSGVKYLVTGLNLFIGGGNNLGVRNTPFYWVGPDGSRVLTFFTYDSYVEGYRWKLTGGAPFEDMEATVPRRLAWLERNGYPYDTYLLMASVGDNADPMIAYRMLLRVREWNRRHPDLLMQMATAGEFFQYLLGKYGGHLQEVAGDAAGHWELVKLGAPEASARMRETASLLPAAEALAAAAAILGRSEYPRYDFSDAWRELLVFHEHTAGAGAGWPGYFSRWETDWNNVAHYAAAMSAYSNARQLLEKAMARIAGSGAIFDPAHQASGREATVLVYNGLSWSRGGAVVVDRLPSALREGALEAVDRTTGKVLPCDDVPGTSRQIVFLAPSVPAVGYRLYSIRRAAEPAPAAGDLPVHVAWNEEGWITSVRSSAEMIDAQPARPFGSLLVSIAGGEYRLEAGSFAGVRSSNGAVAQRIELSRSGSPLRRTVITLYRGAPYADFAFEVDLGAVPDLSVRYAIAFPTAASGQLWLDGAGVAYRAPQDLLPGGGAPQYPVLHFAHFQRNRNSGITLASRDAFLMRPDRIFLIASQGLLAQTRDEGVQRLFRTEPRGSNLQTFHFRMALQEENAAAWERLGQELNLPLQATVLPESSLPPERSFLSVDHPAVQLTAFKPAEFQDGWYVIRLQEIGGAPARNVHIATPFRIAEALVANTVESPTSERADLSRINLKPWQTLTILARLEPK
jgi:alpha-mannosidase